MISTAEPSAIKSQSAKARCNSVPSINFDHARRLMGGRHARLIWRATDHRLGEGALYEQEDGLRLWWKFSGHGGSQSQLLTKVITRNGITEKRLRVSCPICGSNVSVLYYRYNQWACRNCQNLAYSSQLRAKVYNTEERYYEMMFDLKCPPRKREDARAYRRRVARAQRNLEAMNHLPRVNGVPQKGTVETHYESADGQIWPPFSD